MKRALILLCGTGLALNALAQGLIDFRNRVPGFVTAPIFDLAGGPLCTPNIVAELYWAPVGSTTFTRATAVDGTTTIPAAISNNGADAGYWIPNGDRSVGVAVGAKVQLQVRVWDSTAGSFAAALSNGKHFGQSTIFTVAAGDPGGTGSPPSVRNPAVMSGLTSFSLGPLDVPPSCIPEPSTLALAIVGAAVMCLCRGPK